MMIPAVDAEVVHANLPSPVTDGELKRSQRDLGR